jgi:hypothetical protein
MRLAATKNYVDRAAFGLFVLLIVSLGTMKPPIVTPVGTLTPTDIVFPFVIVLLLAAFVARTQRPIWHKVIWMIGVYLFALIVSAVFSTNQDVSFKKLIGEFYLAGLAIVTFQLVSNVNRLRYICLVWLVGSVLALAIALLAILLFYLGLAETFAAEIIYHYGAVPVGNYPRVSSTFVTPSMFCNYLTVTLLIALTSNRLGWIRKRTSLMLTILMAACSVATISIALGGMALAVGMWFALTTENKVVGRLSSVFGVAVASAFLVMAPFSLSTLGGYSSRYLVWSDAFQTVLNHPATGKGLGTAAATVTFQNFDGTWSILTDAHNMFLNVAAQSGVPGLISLCLMILAITLTAFRKTFGEMAALRTAFGISFISAFIFDGLTGSFENSRHLWVLIGLIMAVDRIDSTSP